MQSLPKIWLHIHWIAYSRFKEHGTSLRTLGLPEPIGQIFTRDNDVLIEPTNISTLNQEQLQMLHTIMMAVVVVGRSQLENGNCFRLTVLGGFGRTSFQYATSAYY